ncbi:MED7 protein-domain-containing protein [Lipomyces oligophaga]|uniref:MED7 protein-domain-containing protein n=1 Tax=Lipomyces oligophaga TaxID=45792 RepID=UPI0034CEE235
MDAGPANAPGAPGAPGVASALPPPPCYYTAYTSEVLAALKQESSSDAPLSVQLNSLRPPSPPSPELSKYRSFGLLWDTRQVLHPLAAHGVRDLVSTGQYDDATSDALAQSAASSASTPTDLKNLTRSLLVKYVELLGVLGISPESFPPVVEDMRTILLNIHHLLNLYRPHQARESLILLMEDNLDRKRIQTEKVKQACSSMRALLASMPVDVQQPESEMIQDISTSATDEPAENSENLDKQADLSAWQALAPK